MGYHYVASVPLIEDTEKWGNSFYCPQEDTPLSGRRILTIVWGVAFLWSYVGGGLLADPSSDEKAVACFQEGKALFKSARFTEAAAKFREANNLKPSWKLYYNIGQSEAAAKRHGLALEAFERFLSEGGDDIVESRRDQVLGEVERLRKIVGFLKIEAPAGTIVIVDDVRRGTAPVLMAFPVSVGARHEVRGELDGLVLGSQPFRVTGGQTVTIEFYADLIKEDAMYLREPSVVEPTAPGPDASTTTSQPVQSKPIESGAHPMVISGWAILGTGAAAAVAGGVLGGIALAKNHDLSDRCGDEPCPEYGNDEKAINKMATASTALIAAGGTTLTTGIILLFVGKKKEKRESPALAFYPSVNRQQVAASLEWRF